MRLHSDHVSFFKLDDIESSCDSFIAVARQRQWDVEVMKDNHYDCACTVSILVNVISA